PGVTRPTNNPDSEEAVIYGDVNGDEKVDITDLSVMALNLVDKKAFDADQTKRGDVDGDGKVTLQDLATIRQFVSKKIDKLGPQ
ncbi:MAG: dockerin type I repeat-containing protein, partial [Oscillospiraceae bacterium]|nr:dockerin type I repeat-containing protein [Oscillospiraceae bacterium]